MFSQRTLGGIVIVLRAAEAALVGGKDLFQSSQSVVLLGKRANRQPSAVLLRSVSARRGWLWSTPGLSWPPPPQSGRSLSQR